MSGPFEQARGELMSVSAQAEVMAAKLRALRKDADILIAKVRRLYEGAELDQQLDGECRAVATLIDNSEAASERVVVLANELAARLSGPR